jgi:hypothetical protein
VTRLPVYCRRVPRGCGPEFTTGRSKHSATYCSSPRKMRTWTMRFKVCRPHLHLGSA